MNKKIFNHILAVSLINLTILPIALSAQMAESQQSIQGYLPVNFKQPKPPPDAPKVGRGQGGASRGECFVADSTSKITLTPLLPSNGWGLTASESPNLWVYVAYPSGRFEGKTPLTAELSVEERKTDTKLEPKSYPLELPKNSGIFSISLPHSLESNKWYRWYLVVNCQAENTSANDVLQIEGFLQRRELDDLTYNAESLSPSELVSLYTENHIWYDAFHEAALLHCNNGSDNELKNYWQTLLKSDEVNLDDVSDRSVICPHPHSR
ncbi:MAG: DUF928 domain-containing protein [Xenococcaceae cyanobacterium MO_188.B32]|nr:DUF928 domain-containing protein [Xenococcaceae cyanobacterium MO_188.B32]